MDRRKPELLSPAGDMEKLRMAVAYGADAVYLAGTSFGMRSFTGNFTPDELPKAVQLAHAAGVKVHCTVNIMPAMMRPPRSRSISSSWTPRASTLSSSRISARSHWQGSTPRAASGTSPPSSRSPTTSARRAGSTSARAAWCSHGS